MVELGISGKGRTRASRAARGSLIHVATRVEGAVVVDPLIRRLLGGRESRHLRLSHRKAPSPMSLTI